MILEKVVFNIIIVIIIVITIIVIHYINSLHTRVFLSFFLRSENYAIFLHLLI